MIKKQMCVKECEEGIEALLESEREARNSEDFNRSMIEKDVSCKRVRFIAARFCRYS